MRTAVRNIVLIIVIGVASHYLAVPFGALLSSVLDIGGSLAGSTLEYYMFGLPTVATVLSIFLFVAFGDKYKFLWAGIVLVLVLLLEIQLAPILVVYSLILGVIAWFLGTTANKALTKLAPSFMAKIS